MPRVIEQNIFRLEISVNNVESMQTFEGAKKFGGVESGSIDIKPLFSLKMVEQFSPVDKRKNKIEFLRGLK